MPTSALVPAHPARVQLQALVREGWTYPAISAVTCILASTLRDIACGRIVTTSPARVDHILAVHRALSGSLRHYRILHPPRGRRRQLNPPPPPDRVDVETLAARGLGPDAIAARLGCSRLQVVCAEWFTELAARNGRIVVAYQDGVSIGTLATEHGLSRGYVGQIVRGYRPVLQDVAA